MKCMLIYSCQPMEIDSLSEKLLFRHNLVRVDSMFKGLILVVVIREKE